MFLVLQHDYLLIRELEEICQIECLSVIISEMWVVYCLLDTVYSDFRSILIF
jgi:hypothetical protein